MSLVSGTRIGPYEIVGLLGAGGMGEVYRARDPRLGREVAIKVLPEAFAADAERLARFQREAQVLASLNHPHIAHIHGLEDAGSVRGLVLELVEGPTLAERILQGPIPLAEALEIGRQIASALEAAHEGGVVHRDLKPGNVKINPDGQVKVLDFGLAKGGASPSSSGMELTHSPTRTYDPTGVGVILGTAAYMSPEQARGKILDRRTDIWSFGCVLYECLTGRQAFEGETISDMIARILERDPDWSALPANTPARVRELLARCLEKDAKKRLRDIGDARVELENLLAGRTPSGAIPPDAAPAVGAGARRGGMPLLPLAIGALLGVVAALGAARILGLPGSSKPGPLQRVSIALPKDVRAGPVNFSRDGTCMILVGVPTGAGDAQGGDFRIYIRRLDRFEFETLPGSEGVRPFASPVFSRDGESVYFVARARSDGSPWKLFRSPLDGSTPPVAIREWADDWEGVTQLRGGDFLTLASRGRSLLRLPADGGAPGPAIPIATDSSRTRFRGVDRGVWIDDRSLLVDAVTYGPSGWFVGTAVLDTQTGKSTKILEDGGRAVYLEPGRLLFTRSDALLASRFDPRKLALEGQPVAVLGGLRTLNTYEPGFFRVTENGSLAYSPGGRVGSDRRLVVIGKDGKIEREFADRKSFREPNATEDGSRVIATATNARGIDEIWGSDAGGGELRRLVAVPGVDCYFPAWSPDNDLFAFACASGDENSGVYTARASDPGATPRAVLRDSAQVQYIPFSWSPDGHGLLVCAQYPGPDEIMLLSFLPDGSTRLAPCIETPASEAYARFSPDGRFIAFVSDETGRDEIYVCQVRPDGTTGPSVPVARGAAAEFLGWVADGPRVVYGGSGESIRMSVVSEGPRPILTPAGSVPDLRPLNLADQATWWLPDGRVLAIQNGDSEVDIDRIELVLNWTEELRARMGEGARAAR